MKENICIVCLKTFATSTIGVASPQQVEKCGVSLLTKFLKFAKNFLQIPSQKLLNVNGCASEEVSSSDITDTFCEKCELAVITPICQVYLEFLSAQLRLSWELEQLGKLLEESSPLDKFDNDNKLGVVNIITLTEQLGIESVSHLEEFRSLLYQKCKLKRKLAMPDILIGPRCEHDDDVEDHYDVFEPLHSEGASNPINFILQEEGDLPRQDNNGFIEIESVAIKLESVDLPNNDHYILPEKEDGNQDDDDGDDKHSGELDKPFKCSKCGSQFATQFAFDRHSDDVCFRLRNQLKIEEVIVPGPFEDEQAEIQHPNVVEPPPPLAHTPTPEGNSVVSNNKRKRFSCSRCNRVFFRGHCLRQHVIAKHNPQTHVCSQCSKIFVTALRLRLHCERVHPQPGQEFKCTICAKGFATSQNFSNHKYRHHNTKSFICPQCSVVYTTNWRLQCHIKAVHNSETHVCVKCNKVFASIENLKRHYGRVHPQPSQKEFKCPTCAKGFATRYKMLDHKTYCNSTKSFSCPQCSVVCTTNSKLTVHIKAVHKKEIHVCVECNKVFPTIEYLKVHCKRTHSQPGQPEFKCPICAKGFATRHKMLEHKRRYHKTKSLS